MIYSHIIQKSKCSRRTYIRKGPSTTSWSVCTKNSRAALVVGTVAILRSTRSSKILRVTKTSTKELSL